MKVIGLQRGFYRLSSWDASGLSPTARGWWAKLRSWLALRGKGLSAGEAAAGCLVSRATLYRWWRRFLAAGPAALEPHARRPRRVRRRQWPADLLRQVERLRREFPLWGKAKLAPLLRRLGLVVSESSTGRALRLLMERGVVQPLSVLRRGKWKRSLGQRKHAVRLPRDLVAQQPGDLVQLDTLTVTVHPGVVVKQFTACDTVSRWCLAEVYQRATAFNAQRFLADLTARCPFAIGAIQVDGGSEFRGEFEAACQQRGIPLYVLPPRSPKLNGRVERLNGTWRYEFYGVSDVPENLTRIKPLVRRFEQLYNTQRPHQALNGLTPMQYLDAYYPDLRPNLSHMY